jgi:hypothetical protein
MNFVEVSNRAWLVLDHFGYKSETIESVPITYAAACLKPPCRLDTVIGKFSAVPSKSWVIEHL